MRVITLRRKLSMVLPHIAKFCPLKWLMLHRIKPSVMETVLPERMEPSQMMPSQSMNCGLFHHVSVRSCRLLKFW